MTNKLFKSIVSLLVVALLSVSLFTVGVFADEADVTEDLTPGIVNAAIGADASAESSADEAVEETHAADDAVAEDKSEAESDAAEEVPTTGATAEEDEGLGLGFWISLGIFGLLIIAGIVAAIIKKDKVGAWLKSYKSELKKIVWYPWNDVRKGTIVVVVVVVGLAAIIGLLDFAFFQGITKLGSII